MSKDDNGHPFPAEASAEPVAIEPDWERERPRKLWDPTRRLLKCIRRWQALQDKRGVIPRIARRYWSLQHLFWTIITQCELPLRTQIGGGLLLPHPNGIVVHPDVRIGPNCLIMNQVTLGMGKKAGDLPQIGGWVYIAAGARIVGDIKIGDDAIIGLNCVLMKDVPDCGIAMGVPARIHLDPTRIRNSERATGVVATNLVQDSQ